MLVCGLLLVGVAAGADGVFARAGAIVERLPGGGVELLGAGLALVAVTTALLNLDTAVVFLTPILIEAARRRGLDEAPFLYGTVLMANASSLLLPGANLTNLLVLARHPVSGATFVAQLGPAAVTAALVTAAGLLIAFRASLRSGPRRDDDARLLPAVGVVGPVATVAAAVALLGTRQAALPILAIGVTATAVQIARRRETPAAAWRAVNPPVLVGLLVVAVALGAVARLWSGPSRLVDAASPAGTTAIAAIAAVLVNNLPATVLLSAGSVPHPRALLIGLDVGPNLAVTGSLAVFLWAQAAHAAGARVSVVRYSRIGAPLAVVAMAAALGVSAL